MSKLSAALRYERTRHDSAAREYDTLIKRAYTLLLECREEVALYGRRPGRRPGRQLPTYVIHMPPDTALRFYIALHKRSTRA